MSAGDSHGPDTWPYRSLLLCGHFGAATPASRRLNRETGLAVALLAVTVTLAVLLDDRSPWSELIFTGGMVSSVGWLLLAYRRYLAQLDELSLRIQHEAIAFAFSWTLLLGTAVAAVAIVSDVAIHPSWMLWIVVAELLRGVGLVRAARRYR